MNRIKKEDEENKKKGVSAAERAKGFWKTLKTWFGYFVLFMVVITMGGPPIIINLIRSEISKGEWTHLD
jgi:hypothetical protein